MTDTPTGGSRPLGSGSLMLIAGRVITAICGLIQVPLVLGELGAQRFGVWVALTGVLWTFASFDAGIGYAVQNRIAVALAGQQLEQARGLVRVGAGLLFGLAAAVGLVLAPVLMFGDWPRWLGLGDSATGREALVSAMITYAAIVVALPLSLAARVAAAMQAMWLTGLWTAVGSIVALAAIFAATRLDLGLPGVTAGACLLAIVPPLATALHLRGRAAWLRGPAQRPERTGISRDSALLFLPQLSSAVVTAFVPTLIALIAGPVAAGHYGILQRLFGFGLQLLTLGLQPTWPAYTHAAAIGDADTAGRLYRQSWAVTFIAIAALLALVLPFWPTLVSLWLGAATPPISATLVWAVAAWYIVQCLGQAPAMLLNGMGQLAPVAMASVAVAAFSLALCPFLGGRWGAIGIVTALAVPYAAINLPVITWRARQVLAGMPVRAR